MAETTVTVTDAGPCARKLTFDIPPAAIAEKLDGQLDSLVAESELPGFRKGRAPKRLVEKRFGEAVRHEAKGQIVSEAYTKAIEDNKLQVVGEPIADDELKDLELDPAKGLKFDIEVEIVPEFEMPKLEGIKVAKPLVEVQDAQVDAELGRVCLTEGDLEEREKPEPGDYLTGHGIMKEAKGDTEFYNIKGAVVQIPAADSDGKGMILGVMVTDLAKQFGMPKSGETATLKVKGPEHHENPALRGKDLVVTFEVDAVHRIIPKTPEELAQMVGLENADALKDAIRSRLYEKTVIRQQVAMRRQLTDHLAKEVDFELPKRLSAKQAQRWLEKHRMELMYRGLPEDSIEARVAEMRDASQDHAARELKLFFVLHKAADELDVQITEGDVNQRIAQMAHSRGQRPEMLRQQLISQQQIGTIVQQIREHKALDAILAKSEISEMSIEDFNKKFKDAAAEVADHE